MKKLIAFDLDDTLAVTKSEISDRMSELLSRLVEHYDVCVITGGRFEQIEKQIIETSGNSGAPSRPTSSHANLRNALLSLR